MRNILGRRVDGAIIAADCIGQDNAAIIKEEDIPAVFLDREIEADKISDVLFDSYDEIKTIRAKAHEQGARAAQELIKIINMTL